MKQNLMRVVSVFVWLTLSACVSSYGAVHSDTYVRNHNDDLGRYVGHPPLETRKGSVTYYADSLAGHRTANGERYDPRLFTAASRDLPFGSVIRVVRVDTGHWVLVRINDRGPFGSRARILDLSKAAAQRLDMLGRGVVRVRAEIIAFGRKRKR